MYFLLEYFVGHIYLSCFAANHVQLALTYLLYCVIVRTSDREEHRGPMIKRRTSIFLKNHGCFTVHFGLYFCLATCHLYLTTIFHGLVKNNLDCRGTRVNGDNESNKMGVLWVQDSARTCLIEMLKNYGEPESWSTIVRLALVSCFELDNFGVVILLHCTLVCLQLQIVSISSIHEYCCLG